MTRFLLRRGLSRLQLLGGRRLRHKTDFYEIFGFTRGIGGGRVDCIPKVLKALDLSVLVLEKHRATSLPDQCWTFQAGGLKKGVFCFKVAALALLDKIQIPIGPCICRIKSFADQDSLKFSIRRNHSFFFSPVSRLERRKNPVHNMNNEAYCNSQEKAKQWRQESARPWVRHGLQFTSTGEFRMTFQECCECLLFVFLQSESAILLRFPVQTRRVDAT